MGVLFLAILSLPASPVIRSGAGTPARLVREDIEWTRMWVPGVNRTDRPRVLLIGDSITEAYAPEVEHQLGEGAYVARLTTSKSLGDPALLEEVALVLHNASFRVIHFNNGMHGSGYSEDDYRRDFPKLLNLIHRDAAGARLILATTTPKRVDHHLDQPDAFTDRIRVRNAVVQDWAERKGIPLDDLFRLVENHSEFYKDDGTHFNEAGVQAEAAQVAEMVKAGLR